MKRLRVAVVGAGHLGRIHARLLGSVDQVRLVGVVDPLADCRQLVAQQLGVPTFLHHRQLLGQIDAAIVATPTHAHYAVGLELLQQGIHLLVEKPLAATTDQAQMLVAAARARGLVLQVGHVERFNPAWTAARPRLDSPQYIEATRAGAYSFRSTDIGAVLDLMIHDLDLVLTLVDTPLADVQASGVSVLGDQEDVAHARLEFANGCVANLNASRVSFEPQRRMQIFCPQTWASLDLAAGTARLVRPGRQLMEPSFDPQNLPGQPQQNRLDHLLPHEDLPHKPCNAILEEQRDFARSILTASPVQVPGEQARDALALAERILANMVLHRWTGQPPAFPPLRRAG